MLDPVTFDQHMNRLKVLPTQGGSEGSDEFASRKVIYYEALQDLETERFVVACQYLLSESGRVFFPTPGEIRAESEKWAPAPTGRLLPMGEEALAQLEAQREERRAAARAGLAHIRAELERRGVPVPEIVKTMPGAGGEGR